MVSHGFPCIIHSHSYIIITLHACARSKVIGCVIVIIVVVVDTKITKLGDLGT